ncbi:Membrane protein [Minicystis rosea]|nr:Membrane protein [Minicystis rosea]
MRPTTPWLVILVASIAFRLPSLINAAGTNSDAAVVGLQAMHVLRGEWSPFLWGSGYQTSADAMVAALVFLFTGPSPVALMASTLAGHIVLTWLAFDAVRKALAGDGAPSSRSEAGSRAAWTAAAVVAPLVFTPDPVHTYVLYPPRQASLTLVFVALWLIQGASASRRPLVRLAAGGAVATFAVWADPYALLFLPAQGLLAALVLVETWRDKRALMERTIAFAGGALVGVVPYEILTHLPSASRGQTSLKLDVVGRNFERFVDPCMPWLLSTKVYAAKHMTDYQPWETGAGYHAFQVLAAAIFVAGIVSGGALVFVKRIPWAVRRLGLVGAFMMPVTIGGFLVSPMVMDHFSSRYLAAIILTAPFALAPAAYLLRGRRFALVLAPYLVSGAVSGWVSYRPFGLGTHPSLAIDARLGDELRARGIRYAVADYWASYRLTYAFRESPIVVPTNEVEDRYRPYRVRYEAEPTVAYIHDAYRSRENLEEIEAKIKRGATPFEPRYERFTLDNFTVFVLKRIDGGERVATRDD